VSWGLGLGRLAEDKADGGGGDGSAGSDELETSWSVVLGQFPVRD